MPDMLHAMTKSEYEQWKLDYNHVVAYLGLDYRKVVMICGWVLQNVNDRQSSTSCLNQFDGELMEEACITLESGNEVIHIYDTGIYPEADNEQDFDTTLSEYLVYLNWYEDIVSGEFGGDALTIVALTIEDAICEALESMQSWGWID